MHTWMIKWVTKISTKLGSESHTPGVKNFSRAVSSPRRHGTRWSCPPIIGMIILIVHLDGGFLKWWYPTTMGFPIKHDHPLRKHLFEIILSIPPGDGCTYPTKREVAKIIDSNMPFFGGICDRSLEGIHLDGGWFQRIWKIFFKLDHFSK